MSQLTFGAVPGFFDLSDSALQAGQPVTDFDLVKINNNAKFAAVRPEVFYGWFMNGETVGLPTSPVDGYAYSREELEYTVAAFSSRAPASGSANGTLTKPARASANGGAGSVYLLDFWVEERSEANPGKVHCEVHYWNGGTETPTNDGMVKVRVLATRLSQ